MTYNHSCRLATHTNIQAMSEMYKHREQIKSIVTKLVISTDYNKSPQKLKDNENTGEPLFYTSEGTE
jgi:hypothetical protein